MAKDILSSYGPERSSGGGGDADGGVDMDDKVDVNNYRSPCGPRNIGDPKSPSIHGKNFDYCGSQGQASLRSQSSGSPGLGGMVKSVQGKH